MDGSMVSALEYFLFLNGASGSNSIVILDRLVYGRVAKLDVYKVHCCSRQPSKMLYARIYGHLETNLIMEVAINSNYCYI